MLLYFSVLIFLLFSDVKNWNDEVAPSNLWWFNPTSGTTDCNVLPFHTSRNTTKRDGFSKISAICLPQELSSAMLNSILEYCQFHHQVKGCSDKERKLFDKKFVRVIGWAHMSCNSSNIGKKSTRGDMRYIQLS